MIPLRIAIASGKGGTGKTTLAVSLALALAKEYPVEIVDCDVEEPNVHILISPHVQKRESVEVLVPEVQTESCTRCGICANACRFGALAVVGQKIFFHAELCRGCGLCRLVCPVEAIREVPRIIGWIDRGFGSGLGFLQGILNVGEPMPTPIIRRLKQMANPNSLVIFDAPPGTGCPVIETLKGVDYAILVTEPTPFGLHDLQAALAVTQALNITTGVVISKWGLGTNAVDHFCEEKRIPVLLRIPWDRAIAEAYARGIPLVEALPHWRGPLLGLFEKIVAQVAKMKEAAK